MDVWHDWAVKQDKAKKEKEFKKKAEAAEKAARKASGAPRRATYSLGTYGTDKSIRDTGKYPRGNSGPVASKRFSDYGISKWDSNGGDMFKVTPEGKARRDAELKDKAAKAAGRRTTATASNTAPNPGRTRVTRAQEVDRYTRKDRDSYSRKAKDKNLQDTKDVANYRKARIEKKDFKGKYYGPDAFKGNLDTLKAWRKAGSPKNTAAFAKGTAVGKRLPKE